jgi:hypothetical protein
MRIMECTSTPIYITKLKIARLFLYDKINFVLISSFANCPKAARQSDTPTGLTLGATFRLPISPGVLVPVHTDRPRRRCLQMHREFEPLHARLDVRLVEHNPVGPRRQAGDLIRKVE